MLYMSRLTKPFVLVLLSCVISACASTGGNSLPDRKVSTPRSDNALIHAQLARGYLQQKQYAVAKTELEKALRIDSGHSEGNYVMALLLLELQQYEDARNYFERSIRSNRFNSAAAHDYGVFLCQFGEERESQKYFEIAVSNPLFERSELSYMRAGECLARINDPDAERFLKEALKIDPHLRPALFQLAQINYNNGVYLSARAYIERYFSITKPQPASLLLAYQIELKNGSNEMANLYRTQLLEDFPGASESAKLRRTQRPE